MEDPDLDFLFTSPRAFCFDIKIYIVNMINFKQGVNID